MHTAINWKKGIFSCSYRLLSNGIQIGHLKDPSWKRRATGEIQGKKYEFRTKGLLTSQTEIIDVENGKSVGRISYNCWSPEAKIQLGDQVSHWGFTNIWKSKWSVFSPDQEPIRYQGWTCKGNINLKEQEDIKVLAGLYVSNYFWELAGVYSILFASLFLVA